MVFGIFTCSQDKVEFVCIQQGFLLISKSELGFLKLDRHNSILYPMEEERVCGLIRGLLLPHYLALMHLT